jgi:hypothetical protein
MRLASQKRLQGLGDKQWRIAFKAGTLLFEGFDLAISGIAIT